MSDDRGPMMFDILTGTQNDLGQIKREQVWQGIRSASIGDHICGLMTSVFGMQVDVSDLKVRVDRIERRLGPAETEH